MTPCLVKTHGTAREYESLIIMYMPTGGAYETVAIQGILLFIYQHDYGCLYVQLLVHSGSQVLIHYSNENLFIPMIAIQWNPSIMDTTGTKDFVLYSEVSFAQGPYGPLTIVASQAGSRLCTMKSVVFMIDLLLFSASTRFKNISGLYYNRRSLIFTNNIDGCG